MKSVEIIRQTENLNNRFRAFFGVEPSSLNKNIALKSIAIAVDEAAWTIQSRLVFYISQEHASSSSQENEMRKLPSEHALLAVLHIYPDGAINGFPPAIEEPKGENFHRIYEAFFRSDNQTYIEAFQKAAEVLGVEFLVPLVGRYSMESISKGVKSGTIPFTDEQKAVFARMRSL